MRQVLAAVCAALLLSSCASQLAQLNPPSLIEDDQTLMAIEEFLYATEDLAAASRFGAVTFQRDTSARMKRAAQTAVPLLPPDREKIPYSRTGATAANVPAAVVIPSPPVGATPYSTLVAHYIVTGSNVAQLVCTQFMMDLYDKDEYFQFLRNELNTGVTLTNAIFQLAKANGSLKDTVANVFPVINTGLDNYQKFKYVAVTDATLRGLVLQAMQAKTVYYLGPAANLPVTFAGAVNAVNEIEYLCTRQGIAFLLNHGVAQTKVTVDTTGAIVFNQLSSGAQATPGLAAPINR